GPRQEPHQRIQNGGHIALSKGLDVVAVNEITDYESQNSLSLTRISRVPVNPHFLIAIATLIVGAMDHFQFASFSKSFRHTIKEGFDHHDATGIGLTPDVRHQVLVVLVQLGHRSSSCRSWDLTRSHST